MKVLLKPAKISRFVLRKIGLADSAIGKTEFECPLFYALNELLQIIFGICMSHSANSSKKVVLADADATDLFAERLAQTCKSTKAAQPGLVIYLDGDLGSGKTSLSRRFIQCFIPSARVKSPTYTLVESYCLESLCIHHFDLYRLCDPEELEFIGVRDLLVAPYIALFEWPSKAQGVIPAADLILRWQFLDAGRSLEILACTDVGKDILQALDF